MPVPPSLPEPLLLVIGDISKTPLTARLKDRPLTSITPESLCNLRQSPGVGSDSPVWLGLADLAGRIPKSCAIKFWNASRKDVLRDIQRAYRPDSSATYKRLFAEGLGTFGAPAPAVILVDAYLGDGPEDVDLARGLAEIAEACAAPLLIGVGDPEGTLPPALSESPYSRNLFMLAPRWRRNDGAGEGHWVHPGYLVLERLAAALGDGDFASLAQNVMPRWNPREAAAFADTAGHTLSDASFEMIMDEPRSPYGIRDDCSSAGKTERARADWNAR